MRFDALPLHATTLSALEAMGFEETTPVQAEAVPPLLAGRDLMAQAQTGTGKTAAFGIPLVEAGRTGRRGIVLTPTRELARQVQRELQAIGKGSPVDVVCLIGGASFGDQVRALQQHPDALLVATPGRVVDHLKRGTLSLRGMSMLVLDEADEMLSMGFQEEVDAIVAALPEERQTMLFTATLPPAIERLAGRSLRDPVTVRAGPGGPASGVRQCFALVAGRERPTAVQRIIEAEAPQATLLFARTRERVEELARALPGAEGLHGGMGQPVRDAVMQRFRDGRTALLVATDVAARGLDVEEVGLVLHDEPPADAETYVHRIGRTGRAGRKGTSVLILAPGRMDRLRPIQRVAGRLERYEVPDAAGLARIRAARLVGDLQAVGPGEEARRALAKARAEGLDDETTALAALELLLAAPAAEVAVEVSLPEGSLALGLKVGSMDGVHPGSILGMLVNAGGLRAEDVGRIDVLPRMSVAEVPAGEVERLCGALERVNLSGRKVMPRVAEGWRFKAQKR